MMKQIFSAHTVLEHFPIFLNGLYIVIYAFYKFLSGTTREELFSGLSSLGNHNKHRVVSSF